MFRCAHVLPVFALSLEGVKPAVLDLIQRLWQGGWASVYWGGVWLVGFIATVLLFRMLFTRWGDGNVMKKTLGLSLLVHMLFGMLSTHVTLGPGSSPQGASEKVLPISRVVVEGQTDRDGLPADDRQIGDNGGQLPGTSPAWEKVPQSDTHDLARLERPLSETSDAATARERATTAEPPAIPLPDVTEAPERKDPLPEPDRQTAKINPVKERSFAPIAEETADARPEATVKPSGEVRSARGTSLEAGGDFVRRGRPELTEEVPTVVEQAPGVAEPANTSDPQPLVARGSENRDVPRMTRGSPRSEAIDEGTSDVATRAVGTGATSPARLPLRIGRPPRTTGEADTIARTRPGEAGSRGSDSPSTDGAGSSAAGGAGPRDALIAGRSSVGDPGGDGLIPSVVRSELEGAIGKGGGKVPATYRLRTSPARKKIALDMGANEESERAVETSLQWLADHQHPRGYWEPIESTLGKEPDRGAKFANPQERERSGFQSEAGLTALAVLAFLGKGYTHEDNPFADNVDRALQWLISQQETQGFLGGRSNQYARMYCHGMATIALGEAYGMTKDNALREPLTRAVQYIVDSQNVDGGWRYFKGNEGDMSMFGWQLMALKSAKTAGLAVPASAMNKAIDFLIANGDDLKSRNLSRFGGLAAYRSGKGELPKPSMTAESLFCKQMLGIKRTNRASVEAVEYLLKNMPQRSKQDLYYWYYGTLAMYHHGGDSWRSWNQALRDNLVADQRTDDEFAGSWNPRAPWGDYGGRVFSTALSTLCLEVYYRFLPLYQAEDAERLEQGAGKTP